MHAFFLSPLALYEQQCNIMQTYLESFQRHIRGRVTDVEQLPKVEDTKWQIISFPWVKKYHASQSQSHEVVYYDFSRHSNLSPERYYQSLLEDFIQHASEISKEMKYEAYRIQHVFPKYTYRFFRFIDAYIGCLRDPLFNPAHYEQYKRKHIGVQAHEGNITYAFSFSKEEMNLYKLFDTLESSWEQERGAIIKWLQHLMSAFEHIEIMQRRAAISLPIEQNRFQDWTEKAIHAENDIINFLRQLEFFDINAYSYMNSDELKRTHEDIQSHLPKKRKSQS